jgi:hypothetical protein
MSVADSVPAGLRGAADRGGNLRALAALTLAAVLLLAAVWERVKVASLLSEIDRVRLAKAKLASEVDYLEMQRGRMLSLREVEPLAAERLGLGTAEVGQVVRLSWDEISRPAPAHLRAEGSPAGAVLPAVRPGAPAGGAGGRP